MEEKNKKVYCLGTKDGKGVIEALEERGGANTDGLEGNHTELIYYIDPVTNSIRAIQRDNLTYNMAISNYTEIEPLIPKSWRAEKREPYYTIDSYNGLCTIRMSYECHNSLDDSRYNSGNYYRTQEECLKVADACNEVIKFAALKPGGIKYEYKRTSNR